MAIAVLTETDIRLRDAVLRQLEWDAGVDASAIGVSAHEGAVTLTGLIGTYAAKLAAERAAKSVRGVRAVANDIEVRPKLARTDSDIAWDVVRALELQGPVTDAVQASVHDGNVTLTGVVDRLPQKYEAEEAIRHVRGVRRVHNYVTVAPQAVECDVRHRIVEALDRDANFDGCHITVTVHEHTATLSGSVGSWLQRELAERASANAPGIVQVDNRLRVQPACLDSAMDEVC